MTDEKNLTEVAGEGGTDCPPQKFLSSQKFRHLMGWRNMQKKILLSCLVSEIQLFVYIFGQNTKWPPEVRKGSLVKFFEVSYYQKIFSPPRFLIVKIEGVCIERPNIYVSWTVTKLGPQTCFVNKQLTNVNKKLSSSWFLTWFWTG